jgi:hypothetical protein
MRKRKKERKNFKKKNIQETREKANGRCSEG